MTGHAIHTRVPMSVFRAGEAEAHGWHIDADYMACKEGLRVTDYLLRDLVHDNGWRGAERLIEKVEGEKRGRD